MFFYFRNPAARFIIISIRKSVLIYLNNFIPCFLSFSTVFSILPPSSGIIGSRLNNPIPRFSRNIHDIRL